MSEHLIITCDLCGSRVTKPFRTRITFGRELGRKSAIDCCGRCGEAAIDWLNDRSIHETKPATKAAAKATKGARA